MMFARLQSWREQWAKRTPRGEFWTYFCAALFFNFGFSIFFFLFNLYLLGIGLNERSLGLIGSLMAVGSICGTLPAGILAERLGLRWTLTGGIALGSLVSILRVAVVWVPAQLGLAALSGFALCAWAVCLSPAVAGLTTEEQRPSGFSLMFASGIAVAGLGGLAAGHLPAYFRGLAPSLSATQSERAALLLACVIAALALIPISRLALRSTSPRRRLARPSTPFLRNFLPAMAVWSLVAGAFPPFANVYFVHHLGVSLQSMGWVFSLSQLVQFFAVLLAPLLFRRTGLSTGVMLTQLATAAMLLSLAAAHTLTHAAWLYWAYMASQSMNEPGIYSLLMDRVPASERNGASSYTFFISAASQIVASTAVGISIVRFGYAAVLCGIASVAVVAALLFRRLPDAVRADAGMTALARPLTE